MSEKRPQQLEKDKGSNHLLRPLDIFAEERQKEEAIRQAQQKKHNTRRRQLRRPRPRHRRRQRPIV